MGGSNLKVLKLNILKQKQLQKNLCVYYLAKKQQEKI
jgi:hypothetical protein